MDLPEAPTSLPRLRLSVTILATLFVGLLLLVAANLALRTPPLELLDDPERLLSRVMGRGLDVADALPTFPFWDLPLSHGLSDSRDKVLNEAISNYRELIAQMKGDSSAARATLGVLLREAGRSEEAQRELDAAGPDGIAAADDWVRQRLDGHRAASVERGRRILLLWEPVEWGLILLQAAGLLTLVAWCLRRCPDLSLGRGIVSAPWTTGRGYAVLIRGAAGSLLVIMVSAAIDFSVGMTLGYLLGGTILLSLARKHLFRPAGQSVPAALGLTPRPARWGAFLLATCALIAVDRALSIGLLVIVDHFGGSGHWTDWADEDLILGAWSAAGLTILAAVLWAPIFEEIGFRGLLYPTLHRSMGTFGAVLLSGVIFGAVHLYSLPGFLSVTVGGFVYALSYCKTGSLLPAILAHFVNNLVVIVGTIITFR